ncbi:MAG: tetratricopeptide repeat protein [Acidiferrobacteraceae bacterium]
MALSGCHKALTPAAEYQRGEAYYKGEGVPKNDTKAVYWWRKAAAQGYAVAAAEYNLGVAYYSGEGVPQNYQKAAYWYRKAAEQGDALAAYDMGVAYRDGIGVPENDTKAVFWYRKAAAQGYARAATISSLPTPEQNLMHAAFRKTCGASLSSVMDTLTGHSKMLGSGEYIGHLRMTPGPHRSTNIYWTVNIRKGSPLTYSPVQLGLMESSNDVGRQQKPNIKYAGLKTLKFVISHNGDYVTLPRLASPSLKWMGSGNDRFTAAVGFSYPNCH